MSITTYQFLTSDQFKEIASALLPETKLGDVTLNNVLKEIFRLKGLESAQHRAIFDGIASRGASK